MAINSRTHVYSDLDCALDSLLCTALYVVRAISVFLEKFCTRLNADSVVFLCSGYLISCGKLDEVVKLRSSAFEGGR